MVAVSDKNVLKSIRISVKGRDGKTLSSDWLIRVLVKLWRILLNPKWTLESRAIMPYVYWTIVVLPKHCCLNINNDDDDDDAYH